MKLKDYNPFDMLKSYDFFDSGIMFGIDKFDIVIMNPPYFQLTGKHKYLNYFEKGKTKVADIYQLFMETALNKLLQETGIVSAVVSNKWMRAGYGERTRAFLYNSAYVFEVIDLGANWFESATVDTNIITYTKGKEKQEFIEAYKISKCDNIEKEKKIVIASNKRELNVDCFGLRPRNDESEQSNNNVALAHCVETTQGASHTEGGQSSRDADAKAALLSANKNFIFPSKDYGAWIILNKIEKDILAKVQKFKPLKDWNINIYRGITTGLNEAFIINEETKNKLIAEDKKSAEIIKPLLRGRDIKRYSYDFKNLYLINTHNGLKEKNISPIDINKYKAIKKHLDKFYSDLEIRQDKGITPYNLRNCTYIEDFEKPKIVYQEICLNASYSFDDKNSFLTNNAYMMISPNYNLKLLLGLLNSKLYWWFFTKNNVSLGDSGVRMLAMSIEVLPIPEVDKKTEDKVVSLVERIIEKKRSKVDSLEEEREIDRVVYRLYGLTEGEIKVVENNN